MWAFYILLSQMVFNQIKKKKQTCDFNVEDTKPKNYSALNTSLSNIISDESLKRVRGTDLISNIP